MVERSAKAKTQAQIEEDDKVARAHTEMMDFPPLHYLHPYAFRLTAIEFHKATKPWNQRPALKERVDDGEDDYLGEADHVGVGLTTVGGGASPCRRSKVFPCPTADGVYRPGD